MNVYHTAQSNTKLKKCNIRINGAKIDVEPDAGADTNIMDEYHFKKLLRATENLELHDTQIKLKTLTENLPVLRECDATMEKETRKTQVVVIQGKFTRYHYLADKP